jgi:hypothetical protein
MNNFIKLKMVDPMTETDEANEVYIRPGHILQVEPYIGPFGIQAWGPDGKCSYTGRFKQVSGSLMLLYGGSQRVVQESVKDVMAKINEAESTKEFE